MKSNERVGHRQCAWPVDCLVLEDIDCLDILEGLVLATSFRMGERLSSSIPALEERRSIDGRRPGKATCSAWPSANRAIAAAPSATPLSLRNSSLMRLALARIGASTCLSAAAAACRVTTVACSRTGLALVTRRRRACGPQLREGAEVRQRRWL